VGLARNVVLEQLNRPHDVAVLEAFGEIEFVLEGHPLFVVVISRYFNGKWKLFIYVKFREALIHT